MIYDCFIFFNELDLLEIRLNILNEVVDKFVLVEASKTFTGKPKPLYYKENEQRFAAFKDKIVHRVIEDFSATGSAWDRETAQRNGILEAIAGCNPNDVIIISDLDEIPDPKRIKQFQNEPGLKVFEQKNFYYYLNCAALDEEWYGSVMGFFHDVSTPQDWRSLAKEMHARNKKVLRKPLYRFFRSLSNSALRKKITLIGNGGWQFGFLGGAEKIVEKIEAFSHTEFDKAEFKNKDTVISNIQSGKDLFGRDLNYTFVELDSSFPEYILLNKERLKHLIR